MLSGLGLREREIAVATSRRPRRRGLRSSSLAEMTFELARPDAPAQAVVDAALALVRVEVEAAHLGYSSPWRLAALLEAVDREPTADERYAPSPRSTRGATRA